MTERGPAPRAKPTILVVDDERGVCELLVEALTGDGYRVDCAFDGEEAIARLRSRLPVDLALVDVNLGGEADGDHVAALARAMQLAVILMTGAPTGFAPDVAHPTIRKPFRVEEVRALVRETLRSA
jgi:DNA-binding response OmpR family regulator